MTIQDKLKLQKGFVFATIKTVDKYSSLYYNELMLSHKARIEETFVQPVVSRKWIHTLGHCFGHVLNSQNWLIRCRLSKSNMQYNSTSQM